MPVFIPCASIKLIALLFFPRIEECIRELLTMTDEVVPREDRFSNPVDALTVLNEARILDKATCYDPDSEDISKLLKHAVSPCVWCCAGSKGKIMGLWSLKLTKNSSILPIKKILKTSLGFLCLILIPLFIFCLYLVKTSFFFNFLYAVHS